MSSRPFRLGRSLTGLGLFATKPIKKRTRIAEYKGPLLGVKAAEKAENSSQVAKLVLVATPEMPEIDTCAPRLPSRKSALR